MCAAVTGSWEPSKSVASTFSNLSKLKPLKQKSTGKGSKSTPSKSSSKYKMKDVFKTYLGSGASLPEEGKGHNKATKGKSTKKRVTATTATATAAARMMPASPLSAIANPPPLPPPDADTGVLPSLVPPPHASSGKLAPIDQPQTQDCEDNSKEDSGPGSLLKISQSSLQYQRKKSTASTSSYLSSLSESVSNIGGGSSLVRSNSNGSMQRLPLVRSATLRSLAVSNSSLPFLTGRTGSLAELFPMADEFTIAPEEVVLNKRLELSKESDDGRGGASGRRFELWEGVWKGSKVTVKKYTLSDEFRLPNQTILEHASKLSNLSGHPNIIAFKALCPTNPIMFLTEHVEGPNLRERLNDWESPLSWATRASMACDAARALGYLHAQQILYKVLRSTKFIVVSDSYLMLCDLGHELIQPRRVQHASCPPSGATLLSTASRSKQDKMLPRIGPSGCGDDGSGSTPSLNSRDDSFGGSPNGSGSSGGGGAGAVRDANKHKASHSTLLAMVQRRDARDGKARDRSLRQSQELNNSSVISQGEHQQQPQEGGGEGEVAAAEVGVGNGSLGETMFPSPDDPTDADWRAPEVVSGRPHSKASDVFSYGLVVFELLSLRYVESVSRNDKTHSVDLVDMAQQLQSGCPRHLVQCMQDCCHPDAKQRPTFDALVKRYGRMSLSCDKVQGITVMDEGEDVFFDEFEKRRNAQQKAQLEMVQPKRAKLVDEIENEAALWFWKTNFGATVSSVGWTSFSRSLEKRLRIDKSLTQDLVKMIVLPNTDKVSPLSFNTFCKLFGFSAKALDHAAFMSKCPWFHGKLSSAEAAAALDDEPDGAYLVRLGNNRPHNFTISYVRKNTIKHVMVDRKADGHERNLDSVDGASAFYYTVDKEKKFASVPDLVFGYPKIFSKPVNRSGPPLNHDDDQQAFETIRRASQMSTVGLPPTIPGSSQQADGQQPVFDSVRRASEFSTTGGRLPNI